MNQQKRAQSTEWDVKTTIRHTVFRSCQLTWIVNTDLIYQPLHSWMSIVVDQPLWIQYTSPEPKSVDSFKPKACTVTAMKSTHARTQHTHTHTHARTSLSLSLSHFCYKNMHYTNVSEVTWNQMWLENDQWHTGRSTLWLQYIFRSYSGICLYKVQITTNPRFTTTPQCPIQSHLRFKLNDSKFQVMCVAADVQCYIRCSHSGDSEDCCLLGCGSMLSTTNLKRCFQHGLIFHPEDGNSMFLGNFGIRRCTKTATFNISLQ